MKQNNPRSPYTQCRGCGKRILLNPSKYCSYCAKLAKRLHDEHFHAKARKYFWAYMRKHGRRCYFSSMSLEIDDDTSPWYLVFSRLNPKDKSKIVPAAALLTVMKSRLSKKEFRYYVFALDDHRKKHLKVKKIPLVHWQVGRGDKVCAGAAGGSVERA